MLRTRLAPALAAALFVSACGGSGGGGGGGGVVPPPPLREFDYDVPLARTSPWPQMRRNRLADGRSPVMPEGAGAPWRFHTDKGIFSVPVIGADGAILVGSADRNFYAIDPDGTERWRFETGEVIDSAAAVAEDGSIVFGSGDGRVYSLNQDGSLKWTFAAHHMAGQPDANQAKKCGGYATIGGPSNWFEGNVIVGPGGQLWAGNDNYRMYGLRPDGTEIFAFQGGPLPISTVWSAATTRPDGSAVFGSLDFNLYSVTKDGDCQWSTPLGALISASPAQGEDGTIYVGSWDSNFYAVDGATGAVKWKFPTREHIYSSAAVADDGTIYFGSTDGTFYALGPDGSLRWTFDAIDPIRSSPAVAGDGAIFFSAGDGKIYALNPDGTRRWSYDATTEDRNDLNSSPALGLSALYVGGEAGDVIGLPYGYCETASDARCSTDPRGDLPDDGAELLWVTPGGRSFEDAPEPVQRSAALTFRLVVREGGRTVKAGLVGADVSIAVAPLADFDISEQAGGQWVNLVPRAPLAPSTDYRAIVTAEYAGEASGSIAKAFDFTTVAERAAPDLAPKADSVSAFELRNLAPYQPPLIVSLNQIGFDSLDLLGGVIRTQGSRFILWLVSGKQAGGGTVIDPATPSLVAMNGRLDGASFSMEGAGLRLVTGGPPIDLARLRLASQFSADGSFDAGTSVFAEANCFDLGAVGLFLLAFNLCNSDFDFVSVGTMRGRAYDGEANRKPAGVTVTEVSVAGNLVTATFDAPGYKLAEHLPAIVLVDGLSGEAVGMKYRERISAAANGSGDLASVTLNAPGGTIIPGRTRAVVLADLFPVAEETL